MKYLVNTLGIEVTTEPWNGTTKLPYYLIDCYEFKKATLDSIPCLFMKPKSEPAPITHLKKHIANVRHAEPLPVVLELNGMTARRRKSLIEARIPFVAPQCQIYLPFLGVALNERYTSVKAPSETLMPSAQLLFFYFLYQNKPELHTVGTADMLGFSAMQISRAIKQLTALGLVDSRKDGARTIISSKESRRDLFERAKPHLLNPVRKRIYVEYGNLPAFLPLSSYSALSEMTMLGGPLADIFAFFGSAGELTGTDTLVDNSAQIEVEIWRYAPALLSIHPGIVDTLSLVASLPAGDNERVEQAVEELLKKMWG